MASLRYNTYYHVAYKPGFHATVYKLSWENEMENETIWVAK